MSSRRVRSGLPAFSGPVAQLVGGAAHVCARLVGGTIECAGTEGYLGDGGPLPVADGARFQVRLRPAVHVLGPEPSGASI